MLYFTDFWINFLLSFLLVAFKPVHICHVMNKVKWFTVL